MNLNERAKMYQDVFGRKAHANQADTNHSLLNSVLPRISPREDLHKVSYVEEPQAAT